MSSSLHRFHPVAVAGAVALIIVGLSLPAAFTSPALARGPDSVAPIAEKLIDAVVNISTSQTVKGPQGVPLPNVPRGSPFEEHFEDFFSKRGRRPAERKVNSLGSGFVLDGKEGLIVTNNHVIDGADEIVINFHDGSKLKVDKVLGKDTKSDLALLKVTPKRPLPSVAFGASDKMKVGDWVMAIGNPFGLGGSLTVGILSAKQRDIQSGPYDDFLQTDASINKGNSGGPLFNMAGEVIGVNTAIISPTGGSIGIGFAVPSDTAMAVIDQLRQFGETRRGSLGVHIQSVTDDIAESLGIKENTGALVSTVLPNGPAAKAGIEPGDVITRFDGKDVATMRGLPRAVSQTSVGKTVDIDVLRKGQKQTLKVVVGLLKEDPEPAAAKKAEDVPPPSGLIAGAIAGMGLQALTDELRSKFGIDEKVTGVVVVEVDPKGAAASRNLKPGDVIVEAGQAPVATPEDVAKAVERVKKVNRRSLLLRVESPKTGSRSVALPVE